MYYTIGIDPGQDGAIVMLGPDGKIMEMADWPGDEIQAAKLVKDFIFIRQCCAALEDVTSFKMGRTSAFTFGGNVGIWKGMLAALGIPFRLVRPQTWQKGVIRKADGKKASLIAARRRWPLAELHLVKHHGRADALWIAEWLRLQNIGGKG